MPTHPKTFRPVTRNTLIFSFGLIFRNLQCLFYPSGPVVHKHNQDVGDHVDTSQSSDLRSQSLVPEPMFLSYPEIKK